MATVHGVCEKDFESVRDVMQKMIDDGDEIGASLTVNINGQNVVDIWGGHTAEDKATSWSQNTIANMWSTTKNISSLAALLLVERGLVDLDQRVCEYWPEFAANGKSSITVRQTMSHTSGVAAWEKPVTIEDIFDEEKSTARLAEQAPWWPPGTASGYHGHTHGHLIGAIVRRVTGRSLKQFIREELVEPLQADFQLGAVREDYGRIATIIPPPTGEDSPPPLPPPGSVMEKAMGAPATDPKISSTPAWRDAQLGGGNGHGNGRSVGKLLSVISLGGTVDGVKFLSPHTIDMIFQEQANGQDLVVGERLRFGVGFGLPAKDTYWDWAPTENRRICGWGGWGGSMGMVDLDQRMSIGYVQNKMHNVGMGSTCTKAYVAEIYKCLGVDI